MLEKILPKSVCCAEEWGDTRGASTPFAAERAVMERAVPSRRNEFFSARNCARRALGQLGYEARAILPGASREPLWPEGVVGSITHCLGYRAAVVAPTCRVAGVGIDAEPREPLPPGVLEAISSPEERDALPQDGDCWDKVLFSAKESVFKALFPLTHARLDFRDVEVRLSPGRFEVFLRVHAHPQLYRRGSTMIGRLTYSADLIATSVVIP